MAIQFRNAFLEPLQARAAALAGVEAEALSETLITECQAGATIGWHRDAPMFGLVIGISLVSACTLRFRRGPGTGEKPLSLVVAPRSVYVLDWRREAQLAARYSRRDEPTVFRDVQDAPASAPARVTSQCTTAFVCGMPDNAASQECKSLMRLKL